MTVRKFRSLQCLLLAGIAFVELGCAGVRVYSDPTMKIETGIKVFAPKPYLLVSRTGAKEKPIELSIVYLPDTTDALYVKQKGGWGSSDLSVKVDNGILTEFGTKSDSKIPESLTAMGSLLTAAAGAYKTVQEGAAVRDESATRAQLDAQAEKLINTAADIRTVTTASAGLLTENQRKAGQSIPAALEEAAGEIKDPQQIASLGSTADKLEGLLKRIEALKLADPATKPGQDYNSRITTVIAEVTEVIEVIRPDAPKPATFELYEIVQKDGKTRLVRVEVGL